MTLCQQPHRYDPQFETLPEAQAYPGRHRCAGCAYDLGFAAGQHGGAKPVLDADDLPYSQAGAVRHRDPQAAFDLGYQHGVAARGGA